MLKPQNTYIALLVVQALPLIHLPTSVYTSIRFTRLLLHL